MALDVQPITGSLARVAARLCNFHTGHAGLLPAHLDWLDNTVAPLVAAASTPWVNIIGYASHLGDASFNQRLSFQRCEAVRQRVKTYNPRVAFPLEQGRGETESTGGVNDNSGYWRAVDVFVFDFKPPKPPAPKPNYDRKVRLHFRSTAMPTVPEETALANAQKVYDGCRVLLEFASGLSMGASGMELLMLDASDATCNWDDASDQQKLLDLLGGRQGVGPTDVVVYYVNQLKEKAGNKLNGCAGHRPGRAAVAVAAGGSPWTLAHELGHVLLGPSFRPVHHPDKINIMFAPTTGITAPIPAFTPEQVTRLRASPFCVAI
ncbi:hypothetical protein JQ557_34030 [Bradyrhizobium sp. U87765 SZCCT0131]|uniref:hypothetical protein n=1 Tax=unclassified Bradyrhizobium TaxID=2631580 RepID=UPI001BAE1224|nr:MULTISPECIES: hypothetical protein [unclassified Bradyrhizobium]MBR1223060.1 hypothetical protein [Bradyrhizobium sp. U87765 SZCCT0131]MBR1262796.1 hypothetical protein [Bradyrhizobium sp. U87765 SZCCT0134]MBR1308732.1 hypothetical protein [Bradyrhizobium sp. U87765 SZCCT0110]MBR1318578.1 hypothetical protein [Bradyrhizobium sp. U87765 SZCCT0109]MBR1352282.1 hypothetical protein [Bradyrhizobium sp. U87765 SZCCT0048]